MKVILLAGGFGTRLSEYTESLPKPMIRIGGKPILWHIMKIFANFGRLKDGEKYEKNYYNCNKHYAFSICKC